MPQKRKPPLFLKIAPDLSLKDKKDIAEVVMNKKVSLSHAPRGGGSLTFETGVLVSSNFLRPKIIRPTFSKTPSNQLSYRNFQTEDEFWGTKKYQSPNNLPYPKFQTPNKHIWDLEISDCKFQIPNKYMSILIPKVKEFPLGSQVCE